VVQKGLDGPETDIDGQQRDYAEEYTKLHAHLVSKKRGSVLLITDLYRVRSFLFHYKICFWREMLELFTLVLAIPVRASTSPPNVRKSFDADLPACLVARKDAGVGPELLKGAPPHRANAFDASEQLPRQPCITSFASHARKSR
jgi:hypothetical protein